ncbi:MAG: acyl-CoA desaturase [Arenicellales bacterium]|nr:acyl-CoA desaturase [Arenicellales bacterium]
MNLSNLKRSVLSWIDNSAYYETEKKHTRGGSRIDWVRIVPFIGLHVACLSVVFVGWSAAAVLVAVASYFVRMFAITGFYHRYFSHRSFKTSRSLQFIFAILGATATQRGPIWWAAHHRHHHVNSDTELDCHSPRQGFWWSHIGWFLTRDNFSTKPNRVSDLSRYPELRWLDRFDVVVPLLYGVALFLVGEWLASSYPSLGTNGLQLFVWGYLISTVFLLHMTLFVNSLAHKFGSTRFHTEDDSRNNLILALLTLGEGWHNNHHFYPVSARQGFYWWEIDITFYILKFMSLFGLIWDMKTVPATKLEQGLAMAGSHS